MATIWKVPITPARAQMMRLDINGTFYTLHLKFNSVIGAWVMDVNDSSDTVNLLHGLPLVTGSDLFGQFRHLGIGGGLPMIVVTIGPGQSPDEIPTFENLGLDGHVYFETLV